jgi:hypothetical protein
MLTNQGGLDGQKNTARTEGVRNVYNILVRKPERKRPVERPRCRWEDNINRLINKYDMRVRTGSIWLRIGSSGGLL